MPFKYKVDHRLRTTRTTVAGLVTLEDIERHLAEEDREAGLGYPEIIDARGVKADLGPADVRILVDTLKGLGVDHAMGPTAVLVSDDYTFGMLRMLQILVEDACAIRPFRDVAEAERWLDEQPPPTRPY